MLCLRRPRLLLAFQDILKFFNKDRPDSQSQADLHRRTNRGRTPRLPNNHHSIVLPPDVLRKLRGPSYVGRYSLALWFQVDQDGGFADSAAHAWSSRREPHPVIDMVSSQAGGVLVAQSTVELWQQLNNSRGGGRGPAKASIVAALESLAGGKMPRAQNTKLLNWRTSQSVAPSGSGIVTAEGGRLIFTGDWCFESSFEGCNLAAEAAAAAAVDTLCDATDADGQELESPTNGTVNSIPFFFFIHSFISNLPRVVLDFTRLRATPRPPRCMLLRLVHCLGC